MTTVLITGGRVVDPSQSMDRVTNLLVKDGKIAAYDVADDGQHPTLRADSKIVAPGFVDMHVELREPGREEDETIATGTAAAIAGGFTSIACTPNTDPPLDTQAGIEFVRRKAAEANNCHVFVIACASKNREGKELAEMGMLVGAGAIGFSDAGKPIHNPDLLRRALQYARMFDKPILDHPEVPELSQSGIMHEGQVSLVLGLAGMPAEAEDVMTARDIRLAESTGGRLHIMNVSTAGSCDLIRRAKSRGVKVTAEICAHQIALSDESLRSFDSNCKVNPPLRSQEHIEACIAALADGTIDAITSGHTPRAKEKKMQELDQAPYGIAGLETVVGLVGTKLIDAGHLDWPRAIARLSTNPAKILGISKGTLQVGADADITVIDPQVRWTVQPELLKSKSTNTPLGGWVLKGKVVQVLVRGVVKL